MAGILTSDGQVITNLHVVTSAQFQIAVAAGGDSPAIIPIMDENRRSRLEVLGATYAEGSNTGYQKESYGEQHPDWRRWLDRLKGLIDPGQPWLDLGCAYAFLIEQGRKENLPIFGCDISQYALLQRRDIRNYLAQADLQAMPFQSKTFGLITAFDVMEYLRDPRCATNEVQRCLTDDGLFIVTTPDPFRFTCWEPAHIYERSPAQWINFFEQRGFRCEFTFEGTDYDFVLAASRNREKLDKFRQAFVTGPPALTIGGPESPTVCRIRAGFRPCPEGWFLGESNEIYLLNKSGAPISIELEGELRPSSHLGVLLVIADGRVLGHIPFGTAASQLNWRVSDIVLGTGGHSLRLEVISQEHPAGIVFTALKSNIVSATKNELTTRLPFDLFERYHTAKMLIEKLPRSPASVLDFGGYIGHIGGHWAEASDFGLPAEFTDTRYADTTQYIPPGDLAGRRFDLVMALDVLEHIPPEDRISFLRNLKDISTQSLLIAGPFKSEAVEHAECSLRNFLSRVGAGNHSFLAEHVEFGLPDRSELIEWIRECGFDFIEFEGMACDMWLTLQQFSLSLSYFRQFRVLEFLNQAINQKSLWDAGNEPYRRFFLISRERLPKPSALDPSRKPAPLELLEFLRHQPEILSRETIRYRDDLVFLSTEADKHVQMLKAQICHLAEDLESLHAELRQAAVTLQRERSRPILRIISERIRKRVVRLFVSRSIKDVDHTL